MRCAARGGASTLSSVLVTLFVSLPVRRNDLHHPVGTREVDVRVHVAACAVSSAPSRGTPLENAEQGSSAACELRVAGSGEGVSSHLDASGRREVENRVLGNGFSNRTGVHRRGGELRWDVVGTLGSRFTSTDPFGEQLRSALSTSRAVDPGSSWSETPGMPSLSAERSPSEGRCRSVRDRASCRIPLPTPRRTVRRCPAPDPGRSAALG